MGSVNKVMLLGRLGRDIELKHTNSGMAWARVGLATSERRKDQAGQYVEETDWHELKLWGRTAENAAQYLGKGSEVHVEGRLKQREYTDREGNQRKAVEVVVDRLTFVGSRASGDGYGQQRASGYGQHPASGYGQTQQPQQVQARTRPAPAEPRQPEFMDDDIPF